MSREENCFDSIHLSATLDSEILCVACTNQYIYFATKNNLFRKEQSKFSLNRQTQQWDGSNSIISGSPKDVTYIKSGEQNILVLLIGKNVFIHPEENWPCKFIQTEIQNALFIAATQDHENLIVVDQKLISKYAFVNGKLQLCVSQAAHRMKPIAIAAGSTHTAILEKSSLQIFDKSLNKVSASQMPKDVRIITAVKNTNQFAIVHNGKAEYIGQDKYVNPEFSKFEDDPIHLVIIPPYSFGLQQHSMSIRSTLAPIAEDLHLPFKTKSTCLAVLGNFNIIITQQKSIYVSKYSTPEKHIAMLGTKMRKWENAIAFCRSINLPSFPTNERLSDLYLSYSENMFKSFRFSEAFDLFQKSGKHPFTLLKRFRSFASTKLKDATEVDIKETEEALVNLLKALKYDIKDLNAKPIIDRFSCDPDEVQKALKKLVEVKQSREEIPSLDDIITNCNEIADKARLELKELPKVLHDAEEILFKFHGQTKDDQALQYLQTYLLQIVHAEKQSTCLKIYNTMILQCYARLAPIQLGTFINENPPIFFDVVYDILVEQKQNDGIRLICELHRKHDVAIKFLIEQNEITTAIKYINCSKDWKSVSMTFFDTILTSLAEQDKAQAIAEKNKAPSEKQKAVDLLPYRQQRNAPEVFFSQSLEVSDIDEILKKFANARAPEELRLIFTVSFLEFAIYDRKLVSQEANQKLITTFLELLKSHSEFKNKQLILIEQEKEPIKSYRKGLLRILEANGQGNINAVLSIPEQFVEEKIAAYKSIKKPLEALELFKNETNMKTVFYLLDKLYDPNDADASTIYQEYIKCLCINRKNEIPEFLNKCADRVKPSVVLGFFSDLPDVSSLYNFLSYSTTTRPNQSRLVKIQNALLRDLIKQKRQQLSYLKGGYVEVNENTKCAVCGKPIGDSIFYVLKSNVITHSFCKPEDGLE